MILDMREPLGVRCLACKHDGRVNITTLIDEGHGDQPVSSFRFRCSACGSDRANPWLDKYSEY
jgi:hypothetical protein